MSATAGLSCGEIVITMTEISPISLLWRVVAERLCESQAQVDYLYPIVQ